MKNAFHAVLAVLFALVLVAIAPAESERKLPKASTLNIDGKTRKYIVYVPAGLEGGDRVPAVVVLHREGGTASEAAKELGFLQLADERGFIAVFPQARGSRWKSGHFEKKQDLSDVQFLRAVLEAVPQNYPVDDRRIFVAGQSSGGMMAYRAAAEMSELIAGIGVYGATIGAFKPTGPYRVSRPLKPVPLLHIHGMRDEKIPYGNTLTSEAKYENLATVDESINVWVDYTGCEKVADTQTLAEGKVSKAAYRRGDDRSFVVLLSMAYQTQTWPGSRKDRKKRKDNPPVLDGAKTMADFFAKYGLGKAVEAPSTPEP